MPAPTMGASSAGRPRRPVEEMPRAVWAIARIGCRIVPVMRRPSTSAVVAGAVVARHLERSPEVARTSPGRHPGAIPDIARKMQS